MKKELEDRLRYCQTLPSLSTVAVRVIDLANNPSVDLGELVRCINTDPALVSKLLRVANSPLYGNRRKADNLRQALILLGLESTVSLALGFSLASSLQGVRQGHLDREHYWRRSVFSAAAARILGTQMKLRNPEDLYLGGLLQDIGMLVLDAIMPEAYGAVANGRNHGTPVAAERQAFDTDHLEVAEWILNHWNLPDYTRQLVAFSHDPTLDAVSAEHATMIRCVATSGLLADCWCSSDNRSELAMATTACRDWLGLADDACQAVMTAIASEIEESSELFDMPPLDSMQIAGVLEQAKEILSIRNLQLINEINHVKSEADELKFHARTLQVQATTDGLTGLHNRGWLDERLNAEFAQATEHRWPLSLAIIDLDHFKLVNDTYGHVMGDQVLRRVAAELEATFRKTDSVGRYGGEEFAVVLPGTELHIARTIIERLLKALREIDHLLENGSAFQVTASIGLVTYTVGSQFQGILDLVRAADRALYCAKREGRDRYMVYDVSV